MYLVVGNGDDVDNIEKPGGIGEGRGFFSDLIRIRILAPVAKIIKDITNITASQKRTQMKLTRT